MTTPLTFLLAGTALVALPLPASETADPADRVGFPAGYQTAFTAIRTVNKIKPQLFATVYVNDKAAGVTEPGQLPYPDGSVVVMEWAQPLKNEDGTLKTDASGLWLKGAVVRVDVMRRGPGFGESYGADRAGEWEFASYRPDGSHQVPPAQTVSCAKCHAGATAERDYVFQGRFPPLNAVKME